MISFIGRHWRGESAFWWAVLVWTLVVPAAVYYFSISSMAGPVLLYPPVSRMVFLGSICGAAAAIAIWQLVGTWRASSRPRAPQRWWITRWMARGLALAMAGFGFLMLAPLPNALNLLYLQATDQDEIGRSGYSVSVEDTNLMINGNFGWGMLGAVDAALAANPGVQMVVLNSPGGHVGVGKWLHDLVKARGFDTYVQEQCASACILVFLGGANRYLEQGARLGFHGVSGEAGTMRDIGEATTVSIYREMGVPEDFITRTIQTPNSEMWVPKQKELIGANIVTEIVN